MCHTAAVAVLLLWAVQVVDQHPLAWKQEWQSLAFALALVDVELLLGQTLRSCTSHSLPNGIESTSSQQVLPPVDSCRISLSHQEG